MNETLVNQDTDLELEEHEVVDVSTESTIEETILEETVEETAPAQEELSEDTSLDTDFSYLLEDEPDDEEDNDTLNNDEYDINTPAISDADDAPDTVSTTKDPSAIFFEGLFSDYTFQSLRASGGGTKSRGGNGKMSISIVNSEDCGKRIELSKTLHHALGEPKSVMFSLVDSKSSKLAIAATLPNESAEYEIKKRLCIYASPVIEAITRAFALDYSKCTSKAFDNIEVKPLKDDDGQVVPVAFITIKQ